MISNILLGVFLLLFMLLLWHVSYTEYKEREWRRNNPDEFAFMEKDKVKKE
jgi:hypothetical protein